MTEQEFKNIKINDTLRLEDPGRGYCVISKVTKIGNDIAGTRIITVDDIFSIIGDVIEDWTFSEKDSKMITCEKITEKTHPWYFL